MLSFNGEITPMSSGARIISPLLARGDLMNANIAVVPVVIALLNFGPRRPSNAVCYDPACIERWLKLGGCVLLVVDSQGRRGVVCEP